jgi:hypothetical protein
MLALVTDRLFALAEIRDGVERIYQAVNFPLELRRLAQSTPFDEFVQGSTDVLVVGLTKVSTLTEGTERITRLVRAGCRVRVAVLDHDTPSLYELTARSTTHTPVRLKGDFHQFVETMRTARSLLTPQENAMLLVRTYPWIPTAGVVLAYRGRSVAAQVYFYPYRTDPYERPCVELRPGTSPEWVEFFRLKYEMLWQEVENVSSDPTLDI